MLATCDTSCELTNDALYGDGSGGSYCHSEEKGMKNNSAFVFSTAMLFLLIAPIQAEAQQAQGIIFHRACTALPGKTAEAIAAFQEFVAYLNRTRGDHDRLVFRNALEPNNRIHISSSYATLAEYEATIASFSGDRDLQAITQRFPEVFDMTTCASEFMSNLTPGSTS